MACATKKQKPAQSDQKTESAKTNDSTNTANDEKELFIERGRYEDAQYKLLAFSRFMIPKNISYDSSYYHKGNILSLTNKSTNRSYKIQLTDPCTGGSRVIISNVTTALHFKKPLFEITTPDCSDWYISEFIQLENDSLRNLFEISDTGPAELKRLHENALVGTVKDRDEIVGNFQDYPITVSLTDYSVTETKPSIQKIDWESEALEDIHGYRINDNLSKSRYTIKQGQKLIVDSLFRDAKKIILIVQDSIRVMCPTSEVKDKLQGNAAG
jgi:hypothetical protein